jgi:hypothetical protein
MPDPKQQQLHAKDSRCSRSLEKSHSQKPIGLQA